MDTLSLAAVCILCVMPAPAAPHTGTWETAIAEAAGRFGVPKIWIDTVMKAESGGHTFLNGQPITSRAGAMGLMQIMPQTYADLRQHYGLGADPYVPRDNILAGAAYLKELYVRYGYPNLFAAYNAGPARLDRFLLAHTPLPRETLRYMNGIIPGGSLALSTTNSSPVASHSMTMPALFVALNTPASVPSDTAHPLSAVPNIPHETHDQTATAHSGLFVPLSSLPR